MIKKISLLANKVEQYKEEEDSLRKALISAQTLADKIVATQRKALQARLSRRRRMPTRSALKQKRRRMRSLRTQKRKRTRSCCKAKRMPTKFWAQLTAR